MLEVWVDHSVGEAFTANTDAFKHTVTCQLVHNEVGVNKSCKAQQNQYINNP